MKSLGFFCFFFFFFLNIYIVFRLETGYADDKFESINSKHIELGPATLLKLFDRDNEDENKEIPSSTETLTASTKILPSPEEMTKATAEEYPAKMVPIDVTGAGFQRMSNFRRSLLKITFLEKRKKKKKAKRRNTICEGESGSSIKKEVQDALTQTDNTFNVPVKRRSMGLFNLRRKSADMLESSDNIFLSGNLKKTSISTSCQTEDYSNAESQNKGSKKKLSTSTDKENLSGPNKFFRGFLRSTKLKSLKNSTSSVNKESVVTKSTSNKKGNSVIPISTLSQAMNVAVKMRDGSIRTGTSTPKDEDRNSSSGNWSASSSTRTSFDSDCINKNSTELALSRVTSSCTSRDSTVSEKDNRNCVCLFHLHFLFYSSQEETVTGASGYTSDSTVTGTMSTRSFSFQSNHLKSSKLKTDIWLQCHTKPNLNSSVDDHTSDGDCPTPLALSPFTARRSKHSNTITDDESSVYSVDADGYYTSMHTDSGLRGGLLTSPSPPGDSDKTLKSNTLNSSDLEFCNSDTICIRKKSSPPPPPVRTCSNLINTAKAEINIHNPVNKIDSPSKANFSQEDKDNSRSNSISSTCSNTTDSSVSTSESDPDVVKRLRNKTTIDTKGYPSMVHVSESEDDNDVKATLSSSNYWLKAGYIGNDRIYANPNVHNSPNVNSSKPIVVTHVNSNLSVEPDSKIYNKRSPEPVDIKLINYPVSQKMKVNLNRSNCSNTSAGRHSLRRPTTLNIKNVNISEHDVPMLQKQYSVNFSPVPALYCDSILKQKSALQRSQSMKQEPRSPLSPKSQLISSKMTCNPEVAYESNSLGRKRNKHLLMNVESVVAAQLPLSKKYSTLPTKLKHKSSLNDDKISNAVNRKMYNSLSLDRRNLRTPHDSRRVNSPVPEFCSKYPKSPRKSSTPKPSQQNGKIIHSEITSQAKNVPIKTECLINRSSLIKPKQDCSHTASPTPTNSNLIGNKSSTSSSQESSPQNQIGQSKSKKSTMSAQDLYTAIHNSKKRLNIKTDPFVSPMSSRSTSPNVGRLSNCSSRASTPSCVSPTPSIQSNILNGSLSRKTGTVLAETGFLSPKGGSLRNSPGERKSWAAGSRNCISPINVQSEKPSFASDRLRNKKPTSITDFKKLLLQTKPTSGHQRSAAEILRATSPIPGKSPSPSNASHFQPISAVPYSSPTRCNELRVSPISKTGNPKPHILNPFKRGNRLRSSLPVGGIITSPIWEDNGEGENGTPLSSTVSKPSNFPLTNNKTYGYLAPGNCQANISSTTSSSPSSPSSITNTGPILHIRTRSVLESSV
ncbi:hypothetical protein GQR58_007873 [Nymphon striatum]|nr:hypothetical protein GQR58_007873 [Nymphon striatum]